MGGQRIGMACLGVGLLWKATVLGFIAQRLQIPMQIPASSDGHCMYPKSLALQFGISAAMCKIISKIIFNALVWTQGGMSSKTKTLFGFSWLVSIVSIILLIKGAIMNDVHDYEVYSAQSSAEAEVCLSLRTNAPLLAIGATTTFLYSVLQIIYYYYRLFKSPEDKLQVPNPEVSMSESVVNETAPSDVHHVSFDIL